MAILAVVPGPARADDLFLPPDPSAGLAPAPGDPARAASAAGAAADVGFAAPTARQRLARFDRGLLERVRAAADSGAPSAGLLDLNLFEDAVFRVTDLRTAPTSAGFSITGRLGGVAYGSVAIVVNGPEIAGSVRTPGGNYSFERGADGHVVIRELDEDALPPGAEPLEPLPGAGGPGGVEPPPGSPPLALSAIGPGGPAAAADLPFTSSPQTQVSRIDVLILYTPLALLRHASRAALETKIDLWFTEANRMFTDSGVNATLRPVLVAEVGYDEDTTGNSTTDLTRLALSGDGYLDEAHALRDAVGADVVHLLEGHSLYCGIAYVMRTVSASFANSAFGATNVVCGARTFAHELGHNMGLSHDRYQQNLQGLAGFHNQPHVGSYGYNNLKILEDAAPDANVAWRTIMAYSTMCGHMGIGSACAGIDNFSNPDIQFTGTGHPLGVDSTADSSLVTGPADAVHTLNVTAPVMAAFRAPPTAAPGVAWLRRTTEEIALGAGPGPPGWTLADTLGWRIAFTTDVRNVTADDFVLTSSAGLGAPTLTVSARGTSQRAYDIEASGGGLAGFNGEVELGFASSQNIESPSGTALPAT